MPPPPGAQGVTTTSIVPVVSMLRVTLEPVFSRLPKSTVGMQRRSLQAGLVAQIGRVQSGGTGQTLTLQPGNCAQSESAQSTTKSSSSSMPLLQTSVPAILQRGS